LIDRVSGGGGSLSGPLFWRRVNEKGSLVPHLHVVNVDGSGLRLLTTYETFVETYTEAPSWSPDGGTFTFKCGTTFDENGLPSPTGKTSDERFAVIDADGGGLHLVGPRPKERNLGSRRSVCQTFAPAWQPR
jgi:hypothetical protein